MHFNGLFYFALRRFCSTAILLERINVVKRGTTVLGVWEHFQYISPDLFEEVEVAFFQKRVELCRRVMDLQSPEGGMPPQL